MNKNQSVYCFNEFNYIIENGAAVITGYGGFEPKVLEIPAELDGIPVRAIGDAAFLNFEKITKVIIPENVEEIRASAFSGCWNLKEIILPSTLKTIGCCEEKNML
ncbi:MAG: leucine-rich repeat protein [Peptococcaceae bacterium]|nr:leucine-rich repeat protein [Peptococcaceae bacterium]